MEHFLRLREEGANQNLTQAQTTRTYHDLHKAQHTKFSKDYHAGAINALEFDHASARYLLSAGADTAVQLWDVDTQSTELKPAQTIPQRKLHEYGLSAIHWYPFDNGLFTTSSYDNYVKAWDTNNWQEACKFDLGGKVYSHSISTIASHSLIATACDYPAIRLCDMKSGSYAQVMRGHTGRVLALEWSPTSEHVFASGGSDGTVRLWDVRRANACFALLDMYNSRAEIKPAIPKAHADAVNGIAWSSDGLTLMTTGHDNKLRAWDMSTGENLLVNYGTSINNSHWQTVRPLIIDQDVEDTLVFYPSDEGQILLYGLRTGYLYKREFVLNGRVTCVVDRARHTEIFSGDSLGQIFRWSASEATDTAESSAEQTGPVNVLETIVQEMSTVPVTFT